MPIVKGSKAPQMIVVPHHPWLRAALRVAMLASLLLVGFGAYRYGYGLGAKHSGDAVAARDRLQVELIRTSGENATLRQQLSSLESSANLDKVALDNVRQTILLLRERISLLEEDVLFYKQIMSPDNAETGLVIGRLDLEATAALDVFRYKLEFKQQGNNEHMLSGHVNIDIQGQRNGIPVSLPLTELSTAEESTVEEPSAVEKVDIALEFRYFQNIEGELVLPTGFTPGKVQIVAVAWIAGAEEPKTVRKSFGWVVRKRNQDELSR